jgi:RNA polymerase sigma-70 factor (ECF subfamily)
MAAEPGVVSRVAQPYVAIGAFVTMESFGEVMPGLHPEVRGWLRSRGVQPAGRPFFKYNVIDMDRQLEVEAGFPLGAPVTGEDRVFAAVLPAGRYATLWHTGHPKGLVGATQALLDWAARQGLAWDVTSAPDGEQWGCRLETCYDEPGQDMNEWKTELAFKLAD